MTNPNDLAAVLEGYEDPDLIDLADLRAAAVLLREQAEQLDTLLNAIGDPDDLRLLAGGVGVNTPGTRRHWGRIADAVDALAAAGGGVPEEGATNGD